MSRKIEFNYDNAVDQAMRVFWRAGYSGASLRDLLKAMKIGEGSFYNTVKSKKQLYIECLNRYGEVKGNKRILALTSAPNARLGLRAMLSAMFDCLDDPKNPSSLCMIAAMISGDVMGDSELKKVAIASVNQAKKKIADKIDEDKKAGRLPKSYDSHTVAAVIVTYFQGIWRMAMISYKREQFERESEAFLQGLGL
jgi:TetR/AcrR family transcriptional regulator, transcriptional repressor for nem operon